jgi:enoyl-CoA hydratase/carnithine racemase
MPYVVTFTLDMISTVSLGSLRQTKPVAAAVDASSYEPIERMVKESDFAEGVAAFGEKRRPSWSKE